MVRISRQWDPAARIRLRNCGRVLRSVSDSPVEFLWRLMQTREEILCSIFHMDMLGLQISRPSTIWKTHMAVQWQFYLDPSQLVQSGKICLLMTSHY